jgi:hypothetical protein
MWACWLSGRAPVALGGVSQVRLAMDTFLHGDARKRPAGQPTPPPSSPVKVPPEVETRRPSQEEKERIEPRHDISILGRDPTWMGVRDVTLLDLSKQGCRFYDRFCNLRPGMPVSLRIGSVGPVRGSVRWRRGEYVGIQFDSSLYPAVLEHIRSHFDLRRRAKPRMCGPNH